jgi:thiamine-phosphate pyrophosphorylase
MLAPAVLGERVAAAIDGGARIVQYRHKGGTVRPHNEAAILLALCRARGIPFIVNDDIDLAARIGADGVHLGRDDSDPRRAREHLGADALIGVSCYNELPRALEAQSAGADYVAFGSFFSSSTKPEAAHAPISLLQQAKNRLNIPLVAIGGITTQNAAQLIGAGADAIAVISGVFAHDDPCDAARQYSTLFTTDRDRCAYQGALL